MPRANRQEAHSDPSLCIRWFDFGTIDRCGIQLGERDPDRETCPDFNLEARSRSLLQYRASREDSVDESVRGCLTFSRESRAVMFAVAVGYGLPRVLEFVALPLAHRAFRCLSKAKCKRTRSFSNERALSSSMPLRRA